MNNITNCSTQYRRNAVRLTAPPFWDCNTLFGYFQRGIRGPVHNVREAEDALPLDLANRITLRLFVPPLRDRPMDVLVFVYFYNECVLPKRFGCRYESISSSFIDSILFDARWSGNFAELIDYLDTSAARDAARCDQTSSTSNVGTLSSNSDLPLFHPGCPKPNRQYVTEGFDELAIPFDDLPELAISIFRWHCMQSNQVEDMCEESQVPRLGLKLFENCEHRISVERFLALTVDEFVNEYLMLGLPSRDEHSWNAELDRVRRTSVLGATFDSLQAGLSIANQTISDQLESMHRKSSNETVPETIKASPVNVTESFVAAIEKLASIPTNQAASSVSTIEPIALSKRDAANYLGITVAAIDNLIRTGQIKYAKIGSQRGQVIAIASLNEFIEKRSQPTADEVLSKRRKK